MDYEAWQHKRHELQEREKAERSINWQQARAPLQAAITEQAIRELYDTLNGMRLVIGELSDKVASLEKVRGK